MITDVVVDEIMQRTVSFESMLFKGAKWHILINDPHGFCYPTCLKGQE
jgi:hypothetical protein